MNNTKDGKNLTFFLGFYTALEERKTEGKRKKRLNAPLSLPLKKTDKPTDDSHNIMADIFKKRKLSVQAYFTKNVWISFQIYC